MKIGLVIVKYNKEKNMVQEHRLRTTTSMEKAEKWLNKIKQPAMFYIINSVYPQICCNEKYKMEYGKIKD